MNIIHAVLRHAICGAIIMFFMQSVCPNLFTPCDDDCTSDTLVQWLQPLHDCHYLLMLVSLCWLSFAEAPVQNIPVLLCITTGLLHLCCYFLGFSDIDPRATIFASCLLLHQFCLKHSTLFRTRPCSCRLESDGSILLVVLGLLLPSVVYLLDWDTSCLALDSRAIWKIPPVPSLLGGYVGYLLSDCVGYMNLFTVTYGVPCLTTRPD